MIALLMAVAAAQGAPQGLDTCNLAVARSYVGKPYEVNLRNTVLRLAAGKVVRWIFPHDAVQQDMAPNRLNLDVGEDGHVSRVWCG